MVKVKTIWKKELDVRAVQKVNGRIESETSYVEGFKW